VTVTDTPDEHKVRTFVFDASVLNPFARADRLDVLGSILAGRVKCVTTRAVRQEILAKSDDFPLLAAVTTATWLFEAAVDGLDEIGALVWWVRKLGATRRDRGEATVFAYAQTNGATAIGSTLARSPPEPTSRSSMGRRGRSRASSTLGATNANPTSSRTAADSRAAPSRFRTPASPKVAGPSNIGNYLAGLGIPATAGFGVAYEGVHAADERIRLDTIPVVQAVYHAAVLDLLAV
jgi:hypothetical protein